MTKNACCCCGSTHFENIDVTPVGNIQKRYFTRCTKCGLVIATYGCESHVEGSNSNCLRTVRRILRYVGL